MIRALRIGALLVGGVLSLPVATRAQSSEEKALDDAFARNSIIIEASEAACYDFDVYLALTDTQQRRGLMHVRRLPRSSGMLFVYADSGQHSMWMKNTYLPLDILFIRGDGTIATIARQTEPLSLRSIASTEPVRYVLELNAGVTEALRIDTQSRILLPGDLSMSQ